MKTTRPLLLVPSLLALNVLGCADNRPAQSADNTAAVPTSTAMTGAPTSSDVASIGPESATTSSSLPTTAPTTATLQTPAPAPAEAQAPNAVTAAPLTDAEILEVTHTADQGEIAQAKLAQRKSKDGRVRALAAMMLRDHTAADAKGAAVAKKESLTPTPSGTSSTLESDANSATMMLRSQDAASFDRDYVDTQVKEHQAVLDMIDQKLIPDAQDAEVKTFLSEVRAKVAMHLRHAQDLQSKMQK